MTTTLAEATARHQPPPWATGCRPDSDGTCLHISAETVIPVSDGRTDEPIQQIAVYVIAVDDPIDRSEPATVDVRIGEHTTGLSLTPAEAFALAERLRADALRAAGPAGLEVPAAALRMWDEISYQGGADGDWEIADLLEADWWLADPDIVMWVRQGPPLVFDPEIFGDRSAVTS